MFRHTPRFAAALLGSFSSSAAALTAASLLLLGIASSAQASTIEAALTSHRGDPVAATVSVDDATDPGNLIVRIALAGGPSTSQIRSIVASISDKSLLAGLSITGDDLRTRIRNRPRLARNGRTPFDFRVRLAPGDRDRRIVQFLVSHETEALTLDLFEDQFFAAHIIGDGGRRGLSKASGIVAMVVPEPSAALLMMLGLGRLAATGRRAA